MRALSTSAIEFECNLACRSATDNGGSAHTKHTQEIRLRSRRTVEHGRSLNRNQSSLIRSGFSFWANGVGMARSSRFERTGAKHPDLGFLLGFFCLRSRCSVGPTPSAPMGSQFRRPDRTIREQQKFPCMTYRGFCSSESRKSLNFKINMLCNNKGREYESRSPRHLLQCTYE